VQEEERWAFAAAPADDGDLGIGGLDAERREIGHAGCKGKGYAK